MIRDPGPPRLTLRMLKLRINKVMRSRVDYALACEDLSNHMHGLRRDGDRRTRATLEMHVRREQRALDAARQLLEAALVQLFPGDATSPNISRGHP